MNMRKKIIPLIMVFIFTTIITQSLNAYKGVILNDKFENNNKEWAVGDFDRYNLKIENGKMIFSYKLERETSCIWQKTDLDGDKPYTIETTIRQISGEKNFGHGLIWGLKNIDNYFSFSITNTGYYRIGRMEDKVFNVYYTGWTKTSWVKSGEPNKLKIVNDGEHIKFYVNDHFQNEIASEEMFGDGVGYMMSRKHSIEIDYLTVNGETTDEPLMFSLKEEFDDNNGKWLTRDDESVSLSIGNGKYILQNKTKDKGFFTWSNFKVSENKPFTIETTIKHQNSESVFAYGPIWGLSDLANLYTFNISNSGYYRVGRIKENKWHEYITWTESKHIYKDGKSNKLTIKKIDNKLKFFINDNYVNEIDFESFFDIGFGFSFWNKQTIEIENLIIKGKETRSVFDDIMNMFQ